MNGNKLKNLLGMMLNTHIFSRKKPFIKKKRLERPETCAAADSIRNPVKFSKIFYLHDNQGWCDNHIALNCFIA